MGGAGGAPGARELPITPTWAVAAVCAVMIVISIIMEKVLHKLGEWFQARHKTALFEALEKVKAELMVLGFISLTLTFSQKYISQICIPERYADTMLPCDKKEYYEDKLKAKGAEANQRRLLSYEHRFLAAGDTKVEGCESPGYVPLISVDGLHELHIFIFFLAVFHVLNSALTMIFGKLQIRGWKQWEREIWKEHEAMNDPARFRLTHETSFVRDNTGFLTKTRILMYVACFFRQFYRSVSRADYLTMRHGFISVHLAPGSKFDFQKYIKRSLEDDFKVVVGISPLLWACVVLFLLFTVHGWHSMLIISMLPLLVVLAVGTKLQSIIMQMALEIKERHAVVQGIPLVQVSDKNFWFAWPELVLYLIHYVLFQNAFEMTYVLWTTYEFGWGSCIDSHPEVVIARICIGVGAQIICSYRALPLYALVAQMGSTMKHSIFDEQTSKALKKWHKKAVKKKNEGSVKTLGASPGDDSPVRFPSPTPPPPPPPPPPLTDIEANAPIRQRTENIMATVDLNNENQQVTTSNNGFPAGSQYDLLS